MKRRDRLTLDETAALLRQAPAQVKAQAENLRIGREGSREANLRPRSVGGTPIRRG